MGFNRGGLTISAVYKYTTRVQHKNHRARSQHHAPNKVQQFDCLSLGIDICSSNNEQLHTLLIVSSDSQVKRSQTILCCRSVHTIHFLAMKRNVPDLGCECLSWDQRAAAVLHSHDHSQWPAAVRSSISERLLSV